MHGNSFPVCCISLIKSLDAYKRMHHMSFVLLEKPVQALIPTEFYAFCI